MDCHVSEKWQRKGREWTRGRGLLKEAGIYAAEENKGRDLTPAVWGDEERRRDNGECATPGSGGSQAALWGASPCVCVCACACVHAPHTHAAKVTYELPCNCPWGRKTLGSASWGPRGFTWARMSRMERQGIFPELPQGWATTEGSGWGEPS